MDDKRTKIGIIEVRYHHGFWKLFFVATGKRIPGTGLWIFEDGAIGEAKELEAPRCETESARLTEIVEFIRAQNPYPASVFIEPTDAQFEAFNDYLEQFGLSADAYNGAMGRKTWENCCKKMLEIEEVPVRMGEAKDE
jgi:hypothetical protein